MTKKTWTDGEIITPAKLSANIIDLKDETLYAKVVAKTADYDMVADTTSTVVVLDGTSATVELTLPPATGSGRILIVTAKSVANAVTMIAAGSDYINADATPTITFTPAFETVIMVDAISGVWVAALAVPALT